jgi:hypothetical protein
MTMAFKRYVLGAMAIAVIAWGITVYRPIVEGMPAIAILFWGISFCLGCLTGFITGYIPLTPLWVGMVLGNGLFCVTFWSFLDNLPLSSPILAIAVMGLLLFNSMVFLARQFTVKHDAGTPSGEQ